MTDRTEKYRAAAEEARSLLLPGWLVDWQADATSNDPADDAYVLLLWGGDRDCDSWQVYDRADEIDVTLSGAPPGTGWVAIRCPDGKPDVEHELTAPTLAEVLRRAGLARRDS